MHTAVLHNSHLVNTANMESWIWRLLHTDSLLCRVSVLLIPRLFKGQLYLYHVNPKWKNLKHFESIYLCPVFFFCYHSYVYHSPHTFWGFLLMFLGFPVGSDSKESACKAGDLGLNPGSGRSPEEGNGNPLQYSCLKNSVDRGTW